eukprot:1160729-Pelagomonas_calceolata.AAC.24
MARTAPALFHGCCLHASIHGSFHSVASYPHRRFRTMMHALQCWRAQLMLYSMIAACMLPSMGASILLPATPTGAAGP